MDTTLPFLPGLELSERFFHQAVEPILNQHFRELRYGAARLGQGSDVGFDTPRSMDHGWGPQLDLFLGAEDFATELPETIRNVLGNELPFEVEGFPTHFEHHEDGSPYMERTTDRPIAHRVMATLAATTWPEREQHLSEAYETAAELHDEQAITEPLPTSVTPFHGRPFMVIHTDRFCDAIEARITDPEVRRLPRHAGSISQWVDSTDVLDYPHWLKPLRGAYTAASEQERAIGLAMEVT